MLFCYYGKTYGNTVCTNCYETVPGDTLSTDAEIWLDGLPVGYEKKYLEECIAYCPNCGQTTLNTPHFGPCGYEIKMPAGQKKEDILTALYAKYGNEYIQGAFHEFVGNKADSRRLYLAYAAKNGQEEALAKMNWLDKLRMIDLWRRLGCFDDARRVLKYTDKAHRKFLHPLYLHIFKEEKERIKKKNTERVVLPRHLAVGVAI